MRDVFYSNDIVCWKNSLTYFKVPLFLNRKSKALKMVITEFSEC